MEETSGKVLQFIREKKYDQAVHALERSIQRDPKNPRGYIDFGNLLIAIGASDRAPAFFKRAQELKPNDAEASFGLGSADFEQQQYLGAARYFDQAQCQGLNTADLFYMIGRTAQKLQHEGQALAAYQRAVELDPDDIVSRFAYGLSLARFGQDQAAKQQFLTVVAADSEHQDAYYNLGVLADRCKQPERARRYFQKVLELNPRHLLAMRGLAILNQAEGARSSEDEKK